MDETLYDALEQALTALESGEDPKTVISKYPEIESDLYPALEAARFARSNADTSLTSPVINRSRTRLLARAMQMQALPRPGGSIFSRYPRLAYTLILIVVLLISFSGLSITSAQALPGDQLYPVKRAVESLRLDLSPNLDDHRVLEDLYQTRRIEEVNRLLVLGRQELVEFHGKVIRMEMDEWDIGGVDVHLNQQTVLIGGILPGVSVEVEGSTHADGYVQASEIHLQKFGVVGYVESISPDFWQIDGRTIQITSETQLDTKIKLGDWVVVSVRSDDFGNLFALVIDAASLPTPTPEPTELLLTQDTPSEGEIDDLVENEEQDDLNGEDVQEQEPESEDDDSSPATEGDDERGDDHHDEDDEKSEDDDAEDDKDSDEDDEKDDEDDD